MDKFPEAFERFENDVDIGRFVSYMELTSAFRWWAGEKWIGTPRQWEAFNAEAEKIGFPVPDLFREEFREARGSGSYVSVERRNARFSRKYGSYSAWEKQTERTTAYQRRVANYLRKHPNASLAEARGHRT